MPRPPVTSLKQELHVSHRIREVSVGLALLVEYLHPLLPSVARSENT